ncbi:MAG: hypothetical protein ABS935_14175 [Solibacillus sp.]|uniref:hypothetical protein n=1 Tax=Solibacillus sp. TaxID=1909654 RepID=UPI0033153B50
MFSLLEKIEPTDSFNVWDYEKVGKYKEKVAVYVFWDKKGFEQGDDRLKYELSHPPVYIGSTRDLGKRMVEHLIFDKYTIDFSVYFYGVDVYVFEDYSQFHPVIQKMNKDNLSYISLAEIYEMYFINISLPWFNYSHNNYLYRKGITGYVNRDYYLDRRSVWCEPSYPSSEEINNGFDGIDSLNEKWNIVKNKKVNRNERWIKISEFVDRVLSNRKPENKDILKEPLLEHIKSTIETNYFYMDCKLLDSKNFEIVRGSGDDIEIAEEALLLYSPPEQLIKFILSKK